MTNTKIYISCHKPSDFIDDEIFAPIQVGAALPRHEKIPGILHDDEGKNISEKNPRYCELTAQYWAWQHPNDAKYIGFFHYRRYLDFSEAKHPQDLWLNVVDNFIDTEATDKYQLNSQTIEQYLQHYDLILPEKKDITKIFQGGTDMYNQYTSSGYLQAKDLDVMLDVLKEKHPDYLPYAEAYLAGKESYFNNIFIMRRELFDQYSEWLFDIVDECDKRIDYTNYSTEALRTPGHLAERLLNIYILYLQDHQPLKIKEFPTVVFQKTEPVSQLQPAFKKDNIAVALAANDRYVPYVATVLTSIYEHSSKSHNYDILIMNKDITSANQTRLKRIFQDHHNFSLRFVDISRYETRFQNLFLRGHFSIETWFRLLMPEIMPDYDKVIYLDSDLVVNADLAELYHTNLKDYLLAACHDADTAGLYNGYDPHKRSYMDQVLKLHNPYDYFQAGVIVFNLAEFRKNFSTTEMFQLAASREWELLDQDVLNCLAQGKVKFIDMAWNVMYDWKNIRIKDIISHAPKHLADEYAAARKSPNIIHYAGPDKPWHDPSVDFGEVFWYYAILSGYYEIILQNLIQHSKPTAKKTIKKVAKKALPVDSRRGKTMRKLYGRLRG